MSEELELKIQLTVLNDLGIKLYSNTPAVLSELVANSWDADAQNVSVKINIADRTITIIDDGCGMDLDDLQNKYLTVGYQKRGNDSDKDTTDKGRPFMGRKGIGKLSMFSIAKRAEIHTVKLGKEGNETYRGGLVLDLKGIEEAAKTEGGCYKPDLIPSDQVTDLEKGTRIHLTNIDKSLSRAVKYLRTRLARRFSVIEVGEDFQVTVNDTLITPEERAYFHKIQYIWWIGDDSSEKYSAACTNLATEEGARSHDPIKVIFNDGKVGYVKGWIGFVKEAKQTIDDDGESLNKIILMVRGKLAQEDLLPAFKEDRLGKVYMIGELHADFIDATEFEDIALSSRQGIKENSDRYKNLVECIGSSVKKIVTEWDKKRKQKDEKDILDIPEVKEWLGMLDSPSDKSFAKSLVSKITSSTKVDKNSRKTVIKHCVLAFEKLRYEERLHELESIPEQEIQKLASVFSDISRLEATAYGEIARGRIVAIDRLQKLIDENAQEKEFQSLIAENLWFLDTAWERGNKGDVLVEKSIRKAWADLHGEEEIKSGRIDIAYKTVASLDVIVELKRASRKDFTTLELYQQCEKYVEAFQQARRTQQGDTENYKVFLIVGEFPNDWKIEDGKKRGLKMLSGVNASVVTYQELLARARDYYSDYLEAQSKMNTLRQLLTKIDNAV